jgi:hypothetical protein
MGERSQLKERVPLNKRLYSRLVFCLVAERRWGEALGNSKWSEYYRQEAQGIRRRLSRMRSAQVSGKREDLLSVVIGARYGSQTEIGQESRT